MKFVIAALMAVACVRADISLTLNKGEEKAATVLRSESDVKPDSFNYVYETSNGIAAQADGALKKIGDSEGLTQQGSFQYLSPEGTPIQTSYVADENGFQPQGAHLPTPHPVPDAILRALEYIAAHPQAVEPSVPRRQ